MNGWRDDLPPIPAERIRAEAIREGTRRRRQRQQRQRTVVFGGLGVAAVALVVASGVLTRRDGEDDLGGAASDTAAPAGTIAAATDAPADTAAAAATTAAGGAEETTAGTAAEGTEAPAATEAPGTTEAAASEDTLLVDYTTITGPNATLLPSDAVIVIARRPGPPQTSSIPIEIWEVPPGGPECGPTTLDVTFGPRSVTLPVVHWEVAAVVGEAPMTVDGAIARAAIGPFPPETLDEGVAHEVLVYVTDTGPSGAVQVFRSLPVVLRDC